MERRTSVPNLPQEGVASLSQDDGEHTPTIQHAPDGFKVVNTKLGPDFHCEACDVAVEPYELLPV
jgi:hypothetical protein